MVPDRVVAAVAGLFEVDGKRSVTLNVILVVAVLLAVASVGYTAVLAEGTNQYTEFYLLAEDGSGQLGAQEYPGSIEADQPATFHVGIENHEGSDVEYSVAVKLQRTYFENGTMEVLEEERLETVDASVPDDGQWVQGVDVTPTLRGAGMRVVFLLYLDEPPNEPTMENAYQATHLWVNVTQPSDTGTASLSPARASIDPPRATDTSVAEPRAPV